VGYQVAIATQVARGLCVTTLLSDWCKIPRLNRACYWYAFTNNLLVNFENHVDELDIWKLSNRHTASVR